MIYTILIQYVPDLVRDERINIGVSVIDDGEFPQRIKTVFTENWNRVQHFIINPDFEKKFSTICMLKKLNEENWTAETVLNLTRQNTGSIYFSQPMGTLLPFDEAVEDSVKRYL